VTNNDATRVDAQLMAGGREKVPTLSLCWRRPFPPIVIEAFRINGEIMEGII
jgi:hypothetical protein